MIYTSYFGNRNISSDYLKVCIAQYPPKNFMGIHIKELAPSPTLLDEYKAYNISNNEFTIRFKRELNARNLSDIIRTLLDWNDNVVLLCYEPTGQFCHRYIVAEYLKEMYDVVIEEV